MIRLVSIAVRRLQLKVRVLTITNRIFRIYCLKILYSLNPHQKYLEEYGFGQSIETSSVV